MWARGTLSLLPRVPMIRLWPSVWLDTSFPTGNGLAGLCRGEVWLDRDLRDSTGERWYWHIRIAVAEEAELRFRTARPLLIGRFGPAVRTIDEYAWLWPGAGPEQEFDVRVPAGTTLYISSTIPYGMCRLRAFSDHISGCLRVTALTTSEAGRDVPLIVCGTSVADRLILLTCRHHACEAMASFVLEGAIERFAGLTRKWDLGRAGGSTRRSVSGAGSGWAGCDGVRRPLGIR